MVQLASEVQYRILTKQFGPGKYSRAMFKLLRWQHPSHDDILQPNCLPAPGQSARADTKLTMVRGDNWNGKSRAGDNWLWTDIGIGHPFDQLSAENKELFKRIFAIGLIIACPCRTEGIFRKRADVLSRASFHLILYPVVTLTIQYQKWLSFAVLIGSIATTLLNFVPADDPWGLTSAALFTLAALLAIAYSADILVYRALRPRARSIEGPYYEKYSPTAPCVVLLAALRTNVGLRVADMWVRRDD
jgi:hypothetical protein